MPGESALNLVFAEDDRMFRLAEMAIRGEVTSWGEQGLEYFFKSDAPAATERLLSLREDVGLKAPVEVRVCQDEPQLDDALPGADVLVTESVPVTAEQLIQATRLRLIQKFGSILDDIDVAAAGVRDVVVRPMARKTTVSCAEHVLTLILASLRRLQRMHQVIDEPSLIPGRPDTSAGTVSNSFDWAGIDGVRLLHGRTLGLVGFGEIAREVAARARGFGMEILYHKRRPVPADALPSSLQDARGVDLDTLLERADVVSVHLPLTASTEGIIGADALDRMRPDALLVNMSRGAIVDEDALIRHVESTPSFRAALDVQREEPLPVDSGLLGRGSILLTPHIAAGSPWFVLDEVGAIVRSLVEFMRDGPTGSVLHSVGSHPTTRRHVDKDRHHG